VHRRQHGAVLGRAQRPPPTAAGSRVGSDHVDGQRVSGGRRRDRRVVGRARLLRSAARRHRVRRAGALQRTQSQHRSERHADARPGDARDAVLLPVAAGRADARPDFLARGRRAGQREESDSQLRLVAVAVRRRPAGDRQGHSHRRPALYRRRRHAEGLLLPRSRGAVVDSARVHRRAEGRLLAPQQQLAEHRPPRARGDERAGTAAGQRAQRGQPRTISAVQGAPRQRRVSHHGRSAAGHAGARHQGDVVSDVGRRAVRAAHRVRERRQPRARAIARPVEGAGDAAGARRRQMARRPAAGDRERAADAGLGGGRAAGRIRRAARARHARYPGTAARRGDSPRWRRHRLHAGGRGNDRVRSRPDSGRQRAAGQPHLRAA
jgi:hypothetical protein